MLRHEKLQILVNLCHNLIAVFIQTWFDIHQKPIARKKFRAELHCAVLSVYNVYLWTISSHLSRSRAKGNNQLNKAILKSSK